MGGSLKRMSFNGLKKTMYKQCRICGSKKFLPVIDFGENPLVNSLIEEKDLDRDEAVYPLLVEQCQDCHLVQIAEPVNSNEIYREVDYLYFSGDMPNLKDYFEEYADDLGKRFLEYGEFIVEIGSNDGLMLSNFNPFYKVLGVDPASNVVLRALKQGIPTISDGFSSRLAKSILREYGKAKLIYGNNCIAHIHNLRDLMEGVSLLLQDDGVFVVECNYWGAMVKNKNYALIYHDHFSYFTATDWTKFAEQFGLTAFDAIVTPAQGGSLRIFMSKDKREPSNQLLGLLKMEIDEKFQDYETCQQYEKDVREEAKNLYDLVVKLKDEGKTIAGYGAAAKGFSVLKLAGIDERHISYFVDDSPAKQGKYTPVSRIKVISRAEAEEKLPDYFFITAPNYKDVIIEKEAEFRKNGGKFITIDSQIL